MEDSSVIILVICKPACAAPRGEALPLITELCLEQVVILAEIAPSLNQFETVDASGK